MKKCIVSRSHFRTLLGGILFLYSGLPMIWYFSGKTLSKVPDLVFICIAGTIVMLISILGSSGGLIYVGEEGVGMRLFLAKKRIIPWSEIEDCGVFHTNKIFVVYFSTKRLPFELMSRFFDRSRVRDIDWIAFAEFDAHFVKKMVPAMPPKYATIMRERARQLGLKAEDDQ